MSGLENMEYDVFITYREKDDKDRFTVDSSVAKDLYEKITAEGFKVFYAPMSEETDRQKALENARFMLVIGTKEEYFATESVKEDWTRFIELIGDTDKILVPCYRNMAIYELPLEFTQYRAYDIGKADFFDDIINLVKTHKDEDEVILELVEDEESVEQTEAMPGELTEVISEEAEDFKRVFTAVPMEKITEFLKEKNCNSIDQYLAGLIANLEVEGVEVEAFPEDYDTIHKQVNRSVIPGYLEEAQIKPLYDYSRTYVSYAENARKKRDEIFAIIDAEPIFNEASERGDADIIAKVVAIRTKVDEFVALKENQDLNDRELVKNNYYGHIKDTNNKVLQMYDVACKKQDADYQALIDRFNSANDIPEYEELINEFCKFKDHLDGKKYIGKCEDKIISIRKRATAEEYARRELEQKRKKNKIIMGVLAAVVVVAVVAVIVVTSIL